MVDVVGMQIWWTWKVEDVFKQVIKGNKRAMKDEAKKETADLEDLIRMVQAGPEKLLREKLNTLIVLDVHARDVVEAFVRDSILSVNAFEWESQLR